MSLLAQYPINSAALNPYLGRPVGAVLHTGDVVPGVLHRVDNEHLIMAPLGAPGPAIAGVKNQLRRDPKVSAAIRRLKAKEQVARTNAWGIGAYPYGWGFGNYGWGAGWWWIWPLIFLAALFAFPFWW